MLQSAMADGKFVNRGKRLGIVDSDVFKNLSYYYSEGSAIYDA